jgi:ubiquinone biosynthesis protein
VKLMKIAAIKRLEQNAKRATEIFRVAAKYGFADWFKDWHHAWIQERLKSFEGRPIPDLKVEERVRLAFLELGPTFIKLGQMLGTRPDLVGPEMAAELAHLQIDATADAPERVRATILTELGDEPERLFAIFDETPLASASIAQAHCAELDTGEEVIVKVQHAGIADKILPDLDILASLSELAEKHVPRLRPFQPVALVHQFRRTLLRELDFTSERGNLEEFAANFSEDPTVHFPATYPELSGGRVLTMERLNGILGTETAALAASGVDLEEFARRGANIYLQMIFRDAFYHADPHPGNLMMLPHGVVGVIDCGMAGRLDPELAADIEEMLLAVSSSNSMDFAEILLRVGSVPSEVPRDQFRADVTDFLADHARQSIDQFDVSAALNDLVAIIRRYSITLPPQLSLLLRTLIELEGTAQTLKPHFSLAEIIRPFYRQIIQRRLSPKRIFTRIQRTYRGWERLAESLPRDLSDLLRRVREGSFSVHLHHRNLDTVVNRLVLGVVTAALYVGSSLLWSMKAPPLLGEIPIIGVGGFVAALYLTWRLLRAIRKSGDLTLKK